MMMMDNRTGRERKVLFLNKTHAERKREEEEEEEEEEEVRVSHKSSPGSTVIQVSHTSLRNLRYLPTFLPIYQHVALY